MRLLNTSTLKLHNFSEKEIPPHAILSHTWGKDEVTFQDVDKPEVQEQEGYAKLTGCCAFALADSWDYIWIDTCCIDKSSSAELSEAINSMYRWYRDAQVCYAYMADVVKSEDITVQEISFQRSRWFSRGWTLQELLAPMTVIFCDKNWETLGTKRSLHRQISLATSIDGRYLVSQAGASVATKMSWAANRETSRTEDIAYCLMGLFDVNMPLLYGEGAKAYIRLQEAILQKSNDDSLFAWRAENCGPCGLFASGPDAFSRTGNIRPVYRSTELLSRQRRPPVRTNRGIEMDVYEIRDEGSTNQKLRPVIILDCGPLGFNNEQWVVILVHLEEDSYSRLSAQHLQHFSNQSQAFKSLRAPIRGCVRLSYEPPWQQITSVPSFDNLFRLSPLDNDFSITTEYGGKLRWDIDLQCWCLTPPNSVVLVQLQSGEGFAIRVSQMLPVFTWCRYYLYPSNISREVIGQETYGGYIVTPSQSLLPGLSAVPESLQSASKTDHVCEPLQAGGSTLITCRRQKWSGQIYQVVNFSVATGAYRASSPRVDLVDLPSRPI